MGKYSYDADSATESSKACGSSLRAHFKHCREVCDNIKGMKLAKAKAFLEDVLQFKQAVAFTKFTGGCGRHAQGKLRNAAGSKCRWPQKATKIVLDLLKNAEANAEMKGLDVDELVVKHSQANRAPPRRAPAPLATHTHDAKQDRASLRRAPAPLARQHTHTKRRRETPPDRPVTRTHAGLANP